MTSVSAQTLGRPLSGSAEGLSLYIHIPFCETKCPYCDFNTYAGIETLMPAYVTALVHELHQWGILLEQPQVNTVFLGGGTPSYLPPQEIARVMEAVRTAYNMVPHAEVTLEANPGDLTQERLLALRPCGVNRLSIGVQSLDDRLLSLLGRRHNAQEAVEAYRQAREAGFANVNLDLMYGLPHQTLQQWQTTLTQAIALAPEHLSLYCLTLEPGTPLERQVRLVQLPEPEPDLAAEQYNLAEQMLDEAGYHHYEISNWARERCESRHNLTYWRNRPYLGVGPGAHSYLKGCRFANLRSPRSYIRRVQRWRATPGHPLDEGALQKTGAVDFVESIGQPTEIGETMMLGLRLAEGVSEGDFLARFGRGLQETYAAQIGELVQLGLLRWQDSHLSLTPRGRLLGNEVFQRFLAPT